MHDLVIIIGKTKDISECLATAGAKAVEVDTLLANSIYSGDSVKAHEKLEEYEGLLTSQKSALDAIVAELNTL